MNDAALDSMIARLRKMSVDMTDQYLCALPVWLLVEIAGRLGLMLPLHGGDKPAIVGAPPRQAA